MLRRLCYRWSVLIKLAICTLALYACGTLILHGSKNKLMEKLPSPAPPPSERIRVTVPSETSLPHKILDPSGKMEFEDRLHAASTACHRKFPSAWVDDWPQLTKVPSFRHDPMVSTKRNLFFCPVGKVGSTFFTRWVLAMDKPGEMTSPYSIAIRDAGRGRAGSLAKLAGDRKLPFLQKAVGLVFGRDPFSRIFSAYVDKLLAPNLFYWKRWGQPAMKIDKALVTRCGSEVTFAQFVKGVVEKFSASDVHIIPVSKECNVCQMHYDVIGKLETTIGDVDYTSSLLNISSSFQRQRGYKESAKRDAILDGISSAFGGKKEYEKCGVSLYENGLRMWRKFQIRGIIDSSLPLPFTPPEMEAMDVNRFREACEKAMMDSTNTTRLKQQKQLALNIAYSNIPSNLIQQIHNIYDLDFCYFGYPKKNFPKSQNPTLDIFRFNQPYPQHL